TTLAAAHEHRAALRIKVVLAQRERLFDTKPAAPEHHDHRAQPEAVRVLAGVAHHADDLLNSRRIGGVEHALVAGRTSGVKTGERRRWAAPAGRVENCRDGHRFSFRWHSGEVRPLYPQEGPWGGEVRVAWA